jgi:hypothetical protein
VDFEAINRAALARYQIGGEKVCHGSGGIILLRAA